MTRPSTSCSRLLQLLLVAAVVRSSAADYFDECHNLNNRCLLDDICNKAPLKPGMLEPVNNRHDVQVRDNCRKGIVIKVLDKSKWQIFVGYDQVDFPKLMLRLTTISKKDNTEITSDIDLNGKNKDDVWKITHGQASFDVKMTGYNEIELSLLTGPSIVDALSLFKDNFIKVCFIGEKGGTSTTRCTEPFFWYIHACNAHAMIDDKGATMEEQEAIVTSSRIKSLYCASGFRMYFDDVERVIADVRCTVDGGWTSDGVTFRDYSSPEKLERQIPTFCRNSCDKFHRTVDGVNESINDHKSPVLSCSKDRHVLRVGKKRKDKLITEYTARKLKCNFAGWEEEGGEGGNLLVIFSVHSAAIEAKCVNSCTNDVIVSTCGSRKGCKAPKYDTQINKIVCEKGTILYHPPSDTYNKFGIICDAEKLFVAKDGGKTEEFSRDLTKGLQIEAACISTCDETYTTVDCGNEHSCIAEKLVDGGKRELSCTRANHYLQLDTHRGNSATCDPLVGWTAKGKTLVNFANNKFEVTAKCINACHDRGKEACALAKSFCTKFTYNPHTFEYSCPKTHILVAKKEEFLENGLTCSLDGIKRPGVGTLLYPFDPVNFKEQFELECRSKCHDNFVEITQGKRKPISGKKHEVLECNGPNDLMIINDKRVDGVLRCDESGWKQAGQIVAPFTTTIHVKAQCVNVCETSLIGDECKDGDETCHQIGPFEESKPINCGTKDSHLLYFNGAPVRKSVMCTRKGWREEPVPGTTMLVDFMDETKQVPVSVKARCVYLCETSLIADTCKDGQRCKKIPPYKLVEEEAVTCGSPKTHALFFNNIEVVDSVMCERAGWRDEPAISGQKPLLDFKTATPLPAKVTVECKHKCSSHFVKHSCDPSTDKTCSKAKYDETSGVLTCNHGTEIFVLENGGTRYESFDTAVKCTDDGWTDKDGVVVNPAATKFAVQVKCVQVCHPETLNAPNGKRTYALGENLRCDDLKEMLELNGVSLFSDAKCSKEGWKKTKDDAALVPFMKNAPRTAITANCIENTCTAARNVPNVCAGVAAGEQCEAPDMQTVKYQMSCTDPLVLTVAGEAVYYDKLFCDGGNWYHQAVTKDKPADDSKLKIAKGADLNVKCSANQCTACKIDTHKHLIDCGSADTDDLYNCADVQFKHGKSSSCSAYECSGLAYKIKSAAGVSTYFSGDDQARINCDKTGKGYVTPDRLRHIEPDDKLGCVKQIPCTEHTPLTHDCPPTADCDAKLPDLLRAGEKRGSTAQTQEVKCADGFAMYHHLYVDSWELLTSIKCNPKGGWTASLSENSQKEIPKGERVVCATSDPTVVVTVPTPPPPPESPCEGCRLALIKKKCTECLDKEDDFIFSAKGETCSAKSKTGVTTFNDDKVTYDDVLCTRSKDKEGKPAFHWRSKEGVKIGEVAAKLGKPPPSFSGFALAGIIVGCLLGLATIGAVLGFMYYKKKQKAKKLEEAKNKGLSQKIDSIIDDQTVPDDVKTIVL